MSMIAWAKNAAGWPAQTRMRVSWKMSCSVWMVWGVPRTAGIPWMAITLSVLLIVLAVFLVARSWGHDEPDSRALTFTTLIVANLGLILANRSWSRTILATLRTPNPALWWVLGGAVALLGLILYVPYLTRLFQFDRLHLDDLLVCLASGIVSVLWFDGLKLTEVRGGEGE